LDLHNSENPHTWTGPSRNAGARCDDRGTTSTPGTLATGHEQIREVYAKLLADRPSCSSAGQPPAIINGDLALTSTRLPGGSATVEVACRQPDGAWRWVIDQPALLA
jgi:hypothetical protein